MNFYIFLSLILTLSFTGVTSHAQNKQPVAPSANLNVAILDLTSIRRDSLVVNNIREQVEIFREGFSKSIQKEEVALKTANQDLAKKRNILSPEGFSKERRQFQQKVVALQRLVQQSKQALEQTRSTAMVEVEKMLNKIITKIALDRGINIILRRDVTILASRSLEITADVLKELNSKLPKVKVKKPVNK
jgi:Skp family chaperone for outer membrane proteins